MFDFIMYDRYYMYVVKIIILKSRCAYTDEDNIIVLSFNSSMYKKLLNYFCKSCLLI